MIRPRVAVLAGAGVLAGAAALLGAGAGRAEPAVDYMLHCQGCHLPDGTGRPGSVPSLVGRLARFGAVEGGREFLVRVPGSATSALDDAALAAVLNWMVRRFGPEEDARRFVPYRPEEVGALRRRPLVAVAETRAALLRALDGDAETPAR